MDSADRQGGRRLAANLTRRYFLASSGYGLGLAALGQLLAADGMLDAADARSLPDPLAAKPPHFAPKAKACIYIYLEGAPSQIDLFDPKPKLNELNGQPLPESMTKNVRFAFIKKETAGLMGSPRISRNTADAAWSYPIFCRIWRPAPTTSLMVRSMHTEQFNHHPGQLMTQYCGRRCSAGPAWAPG